MEATLIALRLNERQLKIHFSNNGGFFFFSYKVKMSGLTRFPLLLKCKTGGNPSLYLIFNHLVLPTDQIPVLLFKL